jgi:hypothetical protein
LIRHPEFCRHLLEICHRRRVQADGDLTLELLGVGILAGFGKIVFFFSSEAPIQRIDYQAGALVEKNGLRFLE